MEVEPVGAMDRWRPQINVSGPSETVLGAQSSLWRFLRKGESGGKGLVGCCKT
jgi:hypothetical protein